MPFKEDLDRTPIDVLADKYVSMHSPVDLASASEYVSVISAQVTVPAAVKTLAELLLAVETTETDEVIETGDVDVLTYAGTVAPHDYMNIVAGTFDVTVTLTVGGATVVADQGDGTLLNGAHTGTIDYETGAWALVVSGDTVVAASDITATYDWAYVVSSESVVTGLWMSPAVATEIYATYSEDGEPAADAGILLAEPVFLAGQPNLIANAKFFGNDTLMDIEVMV